MGNPIPLNQPSINIMYALINKTNSTNQNQSTMALGPVSQTPPGSARNSECLGSALPGSGLNGNITLYWDRIDLGTYLQNSPKTIAVSSPGTSYDLLAVFNATYGLDLGQSDIVLESITGSVYTLKAHPLSYVWIGEVTLNITVPAGPDIDLSVDITNPLLDGFVTE